MYLTKILWFSVRSLHWPTDFPYFNLYTAIDFDAVFLETTNLPKDTRYAPNICLRALFVPDERADVVGEFGTPWCYQLEAPPVGRVCLRGQSIHHFILYAIIIITNDMELSCIDHVHRAHCRQLYVENEEKKFSGFSIKLISMQTKEKWPNENRESKKKYKKFGISASN